MSAKKNPPDAELFWESRVADSLGVARSKVVGLRAAHLKAGEHFVKKRNAVVLTAAGLARITELLKGEAKADSSAEKPATGPETTPAGPPPRRVFIVVRAPVNPRLLWCRAKDDKKQKAVLVRVSANTNFMPGMELQAIACGENFWQYTGRLPRRKGRW